MDFQFIFKYAALAFGSTSIMLIAYYLSKSVGIIALSKEGIYNNVPLLIFEIIIYIPSFIGMISRSAYNSHCATGLAPRELYTVQPRKVESSGLPQFRNFAD